MSKTSVFVMTHKKFNCPSNPVYIPLHVGRACSSDLGYLGDNTGDNISSQNCFYGELTGLYWLWKNYNECENIGICHYRRFFIDDTGHILSENDYNNILSKYDIITSTAINIDKPYIDFYAEAHNRQDMLLVRDAIEALYPEDLKFFDACMKGRTHYFGNLMVSSKKLFDAYCSWLFSIFDHIKPSIDVSKYDDYHKRVFGFLSEELLMVYVKARKLNVYESKIGMLGDKAETKEFKLALSQLYKMGQIKEAREMYYAVLKLRPDLRLPDSDTQGELPMIEMILYVCELEKENGLAGLQAAYKDLFSIIPVLVKLQDLLRSNNLNKDCCKDYCMQNSLSEITLDVIAINLP